MALTGYAEDLQAINKYITNHNVTELPSSAAALYRDWVQWFNQLTWWPMNMDKNIWLTGRKKRELFNIAKGTPTVPNAVMSEQVWPDGPPLSGLAGAAQGAVGAASIVLPVVVGVGALLLFMELRNTRK